MVDASFGNFFNHMSGMTLCWGMIFTRVIHFFIFYYLFILINALDISQVLRLNHAPLIILKFIFETCKSYYFPNSLILLLKVS